MASQLQSIFTSYSIIIDNRNVFNVPTFVNVDRQIGFLNKLNSNMKKLFLMMLFPAGVGMISAFAQSTFEKSKMLSKDEVPVTVMQSFQKGFSSLEGKEYWKLHYTEKTEM
jgi:hypothetical protein